MKSWPKVKLGQIEVDSNIAQNNYLVIICPKSWPKEKLCQVGVGSNIAKNHSSSL